MNKGTKRNIIKKAYCVFQNIYKCNDSLASEIKNLETAYFKYKVHTKKT